MAACRTIGYFFVLLLVFQFAPCSSIFLVVPDDVPTALVGIYGFAPRLFTGNDGRFGLGFRLGNHADFQLSYELGPQESRTQPIRIRSSASLRKRRPVLDFLLRLGLLPEIGYRLDVSQGLERRWA